MKPHWKMVYGFLTVGWMIFSFFFLKKNLFLFALSFSRYGSLLLQGLFSACGTWALGARASVVMARRVSGNWCMDFENNDLQRKKLQIWFRYFVPNHLRVKDNLIPHHPQTL